MGDIWKNMKEKVDGAPVGSSFASDWEAMNQKIEAQPALSKPKRRGGLWFKTAAIVLLLALSGVSAIWLWPDGNTTDDDHRKTQMREEKSSEINSASEATMADEKQNFEPSTEKKSDVNNKVTTQDADVVKPKNSTVNTSTSSLASDSVSYTTAPVASSSQDAGARDNEDAKGDLIMKRTQNAVLSTDVNDHPANEKSKTAQPDEETMLLTTGSIVDENFPEPQHLDEPLVEDTDVSQKTTSNTTSTTIDNTKEKQLPAKVEVVIDEDLSKDRDTSNTVIDEEKPILAGNGQIAQEGSSKNEDKAATKGFKESGFRLTTLSVGGIFITDYSENTTGYGGGISVDWQKNGWLINAGLNYTQFNYQTEKVRFTDFQNYDSTTVKTYENRQVTWVDSIWVIQGPRAGEYIYDTNSTVVTDTLIETLVDTSSVTTKNIERPVVKVSYLEIPVLLGHRFRFNKVGVDIYGGAILNQTLFVRQGEGEVQKSFGVDLMFQPAVRYYVRPELSVYTRAGLRYGLSGDDFRSEKLYSSFQLGLSYHW